MVTTSTTAGRRFLRRVIGAIALDVSIYEEVEADRGTPAQALTVVVLSSLAAGLGGVPRILLRAARVVSAPLDWPRPFRR